MDIAADVVMHDPIYRIKHPISGEVVEITGDDFRFDYAEEQ